jgi:tRNA A-37 threonylcarbamoyl transferase component Bud32
MARYIKDGSRLIRDDLNSILFYYEYFSVGLPLSRRIHNQLLKRVLHKLFKILVYISYFTKAYRLKFKVVELGGSFVVKITGEGKGGNEIVLREENSNLYIYKKFKNKKAYEKEKEFYDKYSKGKAKLKLPKHIFLDDNIVKIDFVGKKTLQKISSEGLFDYEELLKVFFEISKELPKFYTSQSDEYLVHGDLGLTNIFIDFEKDIYYVIDYGDSFKSDLNYDRYVLLRNILVASGKIGRDESLLGKFSSLNLDKYEELFMKRRLEKHPEVYGKGV